MLISFNLLSKLETNCTVDPILTSPVEWVLESSITLALLINNAGIMILEKYQDQKLEDKYNMIDINIKGVINGMDAVLK
ncbi:SDR family NAD(P)-dependent oxidoreductase, partial [Mycoplasma mycoides]